MKKSDRWLPGLPTGSAVFVPHFRGRPFQNNIRMTSDLVAAGMRPVPHLAARNIRDADELERMVAGLAGVGAREFLLLGGSETDPAGRFHSAAQLLQTGAFRRHNARRVGFAGHPESHPEQSDAVMKQALLEKIAAARDAKTDFFIATQFCFAAAPFFGFLDWLKAEGVSAPVRLGLAGRVNAAKLLKFAAMCGIGRSFMFLQNDSRPRPTSSTIPRRGCSPNSPPASPCGATTFPSGCIFIPSGPCAKPSPSCRSPDRNRWRCWSRRINLNLFTPPPPPRKISSDNRLFDN